MKNKICLNLIILFSIINFNSQSQIMNYIAQINNTIATIPYVFEGQIQSVEVFAGDDNGNRLPYSAAVWNNGVGYFYDQSGKEGKGYSLTKMKICKQYKGDLQVEQELEILTKSFTLDNVYLLITGSGADADTSIHFLNTPPSHDEIGQYDFILPHVSYPKKLYFADRIDQIIASNYTGRHFYSNFHTLYEMPFNIPANVLQPDGSYKRINAYCALIPYVFDDQNQLQLFLNQITTIDPNPYDFCRNGTKEAVKIKEFGENPFNISVYPNPSTIYESVNVKFDLQIETEVTIVVIDITGKQILRAPLGLIKKVDYDLIEKLDAGIYFLQLNFGENSQTFKITKN